MSKQILIVRNDKLGDFILSFPAIALLKKNCPDWRITVLVPAYTLPMAKMNSAIDDYIIDPGPQASWQQQMALWRQLRQAGFDAVITLFSTFRIGLMLRLCGIPYRLAPATKLAQIFYNHRLVQRRSRSLKPEYQYNADLLEEFLRDYCRLSQVNAVQPPYLQISADTDCAKLLPNAKAGRKRVVIHPGSGGSANNLTLQQYARLARTLLEKADFDLIISAGPGEEAQAKELKNIINFHNTQLFVSDQGLPRFAQFLSCVDLFIAGSTGTLHLAAALNVATLGFYPRRRSATALRWQTINDADKRLAISASNDGDEQDMSGIDLEDCAKQALAKFPDRLGVQPNVEC